MISLLGLPAPPSGPRAQDPSLETILQGGPECPPLFLLCQDLMLPFPFTGLLWLLESQGEVF
jgi:hypothetical protein